MRLDLELKNKQAQQQKNNFKLYRLSTLKVDSFITRLKHFHRAKTKAYVHKLFYAIQ